MAEIAENLHRRELGEIGRAELMSRWVEITAAKQEADAKEAAAKAQEEVLISAQVGQKSNSERNPKGSGRKASGISQAARELGVPRQTVQRAVKIAALAPEAKKLAKKLKAPQAVLLEAAKHDVADDQVAVIRGARGAIRTSMVAVLCRTAVAPDCPVHGPASRLRDDIKRNSWGKADVQSNNLRRVLH